MDGGIIFGHIPPLQCETESVTMAKTKNESSSPSLNERSTHECHRWKQWNQHKFLPRRQQRTTKKHREQNLSHFGTDSHWDSMVVAMVAMVRFDSIRFDTFRCSRLHTSNAIATVHGCGTRAKQTTHTALGFGFPGTIDRSFDRGCCCCCCCCFALRPPEREQHETATPRADFGHTRPCRGFRDGGLVPLPAGVGNRNRTRHPAAECVFVCLFGVSDTVCGFTPGRGLPRIHSCDPGLWFRFEPVRTRVVSPRERTNQATDRRTSRNETWQEPPLPFP